MTDHYVIFINPDTSTNIHTLFSTNAEGTSDISTTGEPTIEELEAAIVDLTLDGAGDNDLVYILNNGYSSGLSSSQIADLHTYLKSLFVTSTTDKLDIFYLTNFMDNCMDRVPLSVQPSATSAISNYSLTFTRVPNGLGCIATTKSKMTEILDKAKKQEESKLSAKLTGLVMNEILVAGTSQPLFVFPDLASITDSMDALKTQYCRIEKNFGRAVPNTENLSLFWFVSGVSIVILVAWVMSYYVPRNRVELINRY